MAEIDALHALLAAADRAGVSVHLLRAAARELVGLLDQPEPDRRRTELLRRARAIQRLRAQGLARRAICERLGISSQQYQRARESHRGSDERLAQNGCQSLKETPVDLKQSSIGLGSMPAPRPTLHVKPAPPADTTPRDNGGLSVGQTSGNFALRGMGASPENARPP